MKLSLLRINFLANLANQLWTAVLGLAMVPVFVRMLGVEAYGLIGLSVTLQVGLSVLDNGLSGALNRTMARDGAAGAWRSGSRLLRRCEWLIWSLALVVALLAVVFSGFAARDWLSSKSLAPGQLESAAALIGIGAALLWPSNIYLGALAGMQRQVTMNAILVTCFTLRYLGVVPAMLVWGADLVVFFGWNAAVNALQTLTLSLATYRYLRLRRVTSATKLNAASEPIEVRRFAMGVSGIAALSFILMQGDRIILSATLSLEVFGYYALAATLAGAIFRVIHPLFASTYPRFSELLAAGDHGRLVETYHNASQVMAVALLPAALYIAFFSADVLRLWAMNDTIADRAAPVLALLILGNVIAASTNLGYAVQLARGRTHQIFLINFIAALIYVPLVIGMSTRYGGVGAAAALLLVNAAAAAASLREYHADVLKKQFSVWLRVDVAPAIVAALVVCVAAFTALRQAGETRPGYVVMFMIAVIVQLAAIAVTRHPRYLALAAIRRLSSRP